MTPTPTMSPPSARKRAALSKLFWPALLLSVAAFSSRPAQAQTPAAGSSIGNQATATYTDSGNVTRSTQSNTVITTVTQVAALTLTETQSIDKTPGSPVFFPHTLRNTGNGTDTFGLNLVESGTDSFNIGALIYPDANGDGQPDNFTSITTTGPIAAGAVFNFVVGGTVPAGATAGNTGVVTVTGTSVLTNTVTASNVDTVNVTANAAVTILKTVSQPSAAPPATTNPNPAPGDPNTYTYTLQYTNTGNQAAANLTLTDVVPAGFTYVPGSGRWSVTGAAVLTDASDGTTNGIDYHVTGGTVTATIASVPTNSTGNVSFQVYLPSGVAPQTITNRVNISYDDDNNAGTPDRTGTDTVDFQVLPANAVTFVGPADIPAANQGATILFPNTLTNTGTATDRFDVVVNAGTSTFPTGSTYRLLQSDGATTLQDSNGNAIPDTGPVLAGAQYVVYLEVRLPAGTSGGGIYTVTKTATSITDPTKTATATDRLTTITPSQVELTNGPTNAGAGAITATPVTTNTVAPGGTTVFQLNVQNLVGSADSYALSYTTGAGPAFNFAPATPLPAGFTLVFRAANDPNAAVITNTGTIAPLGFRTVYAFVTAPAGAVAASYDLGFRVVSPTTGAADVKFDRVTVNALRSLAVEPNNASQIFPGATKNYVHTVVNTGNQTETNIAIALSGDANGFSSVAYLDTNGNGVLDGTEANTPLTTIPSLAPGASASVIVRVFAPLGASDGLQNTTTLTASVAGGPSDTATDTTTVVTGDLIVVKEQSVDPDGPGAAPFGAYTQGTGTVRPGGFIRYRITATNTGGAPVTNVVITDVPPALTGYSAGDGTTSATGVAAFTLDNGATYTALTGANGTTPTVGSRTQVIANIPAIANGQSAIVYFQVTVSP